MKWTRSPTSRVTRQSGLQPRQQRSFGVAGAVRLTPDDCVFAADLRLQLKDSVHELLCRRWTTRHIHVDRDDAIAATPPNSCSGSNLRRSHTSPSRSPSVAQPSGLRPCAVRAPSCCITCPKRSSGRFGSKQHAEAVKVVARSGRVNHFDRTTREAEGHRPQRSRLRPVDQAVNAGGDETLLFN